MSLVLYGGGIIDNRGSISGNTFSRSKFGATIRAKTTPINIRNEKTTQRRAFLQATAGQWSNILTETERQAWNAFALLNPRTNVFGQISYLSGMQWFTKCNAVLAQYGGAPVTTPPTTGSYPSITSLSVTATAGSPGALNVTWVNPTLPGTGTFEIWATPNLTPGTYYVNSKLRYVDRIAGSSDTVDFEAGWHRTFGDIPFLAGSKIYILCHNLDTDTGVTSAGVFASCIIT